jgi:hypothetical protein
MGCLFPIGRIGRNGSGCVGCVGCTLPLLLLIVFVLIPVVTLGVHRQQALTSGHHPKHHALSQAVQRTPRGAP